MWCGVVGVAVWCGVVWLGLWLMCGVVWCGVVDDGLGKLCGVDIFRSCYLVYCFIRFIL